MPYSVYEIREPRLLHYIAGVAAAMAAPVSIGAVFLYPEIDALTDCLRGGSLCKSLTDSIPLSLLGPIFIVGACLAAVFGVRTVRDKIGSIVSVWEFGAIGIAAASLAQFICAVATSYVTIAHGGMFADSSYASVSSLTEDIILVTVLMIISNIVLWFLITLPLSFICGLLFRWVAVRRRFEVQSAVKGQQ